MGQRLTKNHSKLANRSPLANDTTQLRTSSENIAKGAGTRSVQTPFFSGLHLYTGDFITVV